MDSSIGHLIVLLDEIPSGSMPLNDGDVLTLGRGAECNVRIRVSSVSKLSARLVGEENVAFFINETLVNPAILTRQGAQLDIPIGVPIYLEHGDRLKFATRDFLFEYGASLAIFLLPFHFSFGLTLTFTLNPTHSFFL